ncbi:hypothetical protein G6F61_014374 [Rhizopus arrhizus]|nr:hypothetical protein G6F61_014374 [Rhizopus arrhizus]
MAHKDWTVDDWKRVVWSDETKINRFNSDGRTWTWIRSGESLKSHHVKMTVKHGGGNIMLWSAITYAGVGWMCKINGNMDKTLYKEISEDELDDLSKNRKEQERTRLDKEIALFNKKMILYLYFSYTDNISCYGLIINEYDITDDK